MRGKDITSAKRRWLQWLLLLCGGVELLALVPTFWPVGWLEAVNSLLGLPPFPQAPVAEFLARQLSGMWAAHGLLLVLLSRDLDRYAPLIAYAAWSFVIAGPLLVLLDLRGGLPPLWVIGDGPGCLMTGLLMLWLQRGVSSSKVEAG